jgi:branched-chain amino acid transport system substrate-binding protein
VPSVPAVLLATVVLVFGLAACTTAEGSPAAGATRGERPDEPRRIVVLADLPPSIARSPDAPAADGVDVAIERRGGRAGDHAVTAELLDLTGDPALALETVRELIADPDVLAAVIAPFSEPTPEVLEALAGSGMPVIVLSPDVELPGGIAPWRRIVPPASRQVSGVAHAVAAIDGVGRHTSVCIAGPHGAGRLMPELAVALRVPGRSRFGLALPPDDELPEPPLPQEAARSILDAGCRTLVWTGGPETGGAFRAATAHRAATAGRPVPRFVVTDAARSEAFVAAAAGSAAGAFGTCACVDLSTSTSLDAQRFVNDFQFSSGTAPGPYAVEGYDAGTLLLDAIEAGRGFGSPTSRQATADGLRAIETVAGLGGRIAFAPGGEPVPAGPAIHPSRVVGGRWNPIGAEIDR